MEQGIQDFTGDLIGRVTSFEKQMQSLNSGIESRENFVSTALERLNNQVQVIENCTKLQNVFL